MRDYRWFKILLRAIGLLLLGLSIPYVTSAVETVLYYFRADYRSAGYPWERAAATTAGAVAQVLLGLYLLSGAPKFVRYCIEQAEARCIRCDYDIRGLTGQCPECGLPITSQSAPPQSDAHSSGPTSG